MAPRTARMLMHHGRLRAGDRVLVLGASGGVGNCSVQLAKSAGCYVVGACGSEARCRQLRELFGVDDTINTAEEDVVDATRRLTGGSLEEAGVLQSLPWHHRDPFDRLLVAHAIAEGATLVTRDRQLAKYGVPTLW
jgi:NADPH:quinone reductase-like Zn-dependent oxidoreductase